MEQLSRCPPSSSSSPRQHSCVTVTEGVPAPQGCPIPAGRQRDEEMLFAFLCLTSLLCKWGCKTGKKPWKENKRLGWLFEITSKVIINESSGKGAVFPLPARREVCCRFAALLRVGISFPHTWAWHQTPLQQLTAVTSRMLTWKIAEQCSLWLKKKI